MRYLLGTLTAEERTHFEEKYFHDDTLFEELEIAEDELVDAYVRKQLSSEDTERFEQHLKTSERLRERVHFAGTMMRSITSRNEIRPSPVRQSPWNSFFKWLVPLQPAYRAALAACVVTAVLGVNVLSLQWIRFRTEERRLAAERSTIESQKQDLSQQLAKQKAQTDQLTSEVQNARAVNERLDRELQATRDQLQSMPGVVPSFLLYSGFSRGTNSQRDLSIGKTVATIQLKLALESDEYNSYRAVIKSADDREVLSRTNLKARGASSARVIPLQLNTRNLTPGEYVVHVSGSTPSGPDGFVANYLFRLIKK